MMDKNTGKYEFFVIHYDMAKLNDIIFQILKFINQWMMKNISLKIIVLIYEILLKTKNAANLLQNLKKKTN